jgi:hypothetical protein
MFEVATQQVEVNPKLDECRILKGAVNLLVRILPLIFEDKEFFMRSMWHEQPYFNNQVNALRLLEAISILLFKPGFTIQSLNGVQPQMYAIDENLVWKSGITVLEAANHNRRDFDQNRIALLRLMIVMLSQPLFHSPEEYLVILNPFNTFFTNRNCKNVKNLFISLVNVIISYDCTGYVSGILFLTSDRAYPT